MLERVAGDEMTKKRFTYSGIKNELCGWTIYRIIGDKRFITLKTDWTDWLGDDNTELEIDSQDYKYVVLEGAYEYDLGELNILCKSGDKIIPSEILIDKSLNRYKIVINIEGLNVDEMHIKLICDNYFVPAEELNLDDNRRLTLRYPEQIFLTNGLDYTANGGGIKMSMLSIIVPAYNEEKIINKTADVISGLMVNAGIEYELLVINDGSKDNTWLEIMGKANSNKNIKGICFSRNFGKEAAIFAGLDNCIGDCAVVIDWWTQQHPPEK